jgi:small-conductance mechanosensitive channel
MKDKNYIWTLLMGPNGDVSSKRTMAILLIICGIIFAFINVSADITTSILIGAGVGLLGVGAITKT